MIEDYLITVDTRNLNTNTCSYNFSLHFCFLYIRLFIFSDTSFNPMPLNDPTVVWVTKWVDYSNKYGFGFQLSNDVMGVLFNDTSRIVMSPDGRYVFMLTFN